MTDIENDRMVRYVERYLTMKDWDEAQDADKVRFSVSLESIENRRLDVLLKKIGMKKTEFVADAIKLLVAEFELQLKLDPKNNKEYWDEIYKKDKK